MQDDLHKRASGVPASCAKKTTPECLQDLYNIPRSPATAEQNSLYVSGLGGEVSSADDLQASACIPRSVHASYVWN